MRLQSVVTANPAPWVAMPQELVDQLDKWSELLLDLWRAAASVGGQFKSVTPGCRADREDRLLEERLGWRGETIAAGFAGAGLVQGSSRYLLGLRALIPEELILSPYPLARAAVEHASRGVWLLDPEVPADLRVARHWIERLHGACQRRWALRGVGGSEESTAKRRRDEVRQQLHRLFPNAVVKVDDPKDVGDWMVLGEGSPSLTQAAARLSVVGLRRGSGVYNILALLSHPSLTELQSLTLESRHDGFTVRDWQVDPAHVCRPLESAALAVYRATWAFCSFFELDGSKLEEWADAASKVCPHLFNAAPKGS